MGFTVVQTHYGRALGEAVLGAVQAVQAGDALRPITVLLPNRAMGFALRRQIAHLAATPEGQAHAGHAGVRFEIPGRLAELLGAPRLQQQGKRPRTRAALTEALRTVVAQHPGVFAAVADHPSTLRALTRSAEDLRRIASDGPLDVRGATARDTVRIAQQAFALLAHTYDEEDLLDAAAQAIKENSWLLRDVGDVVAVITEVPRPRVLQLLQALAATREVQLVVTFSGDEAADAALHGLLNSLGSTATYRTAAVASPALIISTPDPETEVAAALRQISARFHDGMPLHRMALLWADAKPYALLVRDAVHAAGLPASGLARPQLADSPTGRALTGLINLAGGRLPRDEVSAWLALAPIRQTTDGEQVDAATWNAVAKRAGVVRDATQWRERLLRHASDAQRAHERAADDPGQRTRFPHNEAEQARALASFIAELAANLHVPSGGWAALATWADGLLQRYVGQPRESWSDEHIEADRRVRQALRELATLDEIHDSPNSIGPNSINIDAFRAAVTAELQTRMGGGPRSGQGLLTGGLEQAVGQELDVLVIVGLVEGAAPARVREDPLLNDAQRSVLPGMNLRSERPLKQRRAYLAALHSAQEVLLCTARSDPRSGRARFASRWLMDAAAQLEGRALTSDELASMHDRRWLHWVASFPQSLHEPAAGPGELLLSALSARVSRGEALHQQYDLPDTLRQAAAAVHERNHGTLGPYTGLVGAQAVALGDRPLSPTRLQTWALCPFRYLLEHVLHVQEDEHPEEIVRISPRDRGKLVHQILERFTRECGDVPPHNAPWPQPAHELMRTIALDECAHMERKGLTGSALLWGIERERLLRELEAFLRDEPALRAARGTHPIAAELAFGFEGDAPVLALHDGRTISFRGFIDRVEASTDSQQLTVVDYKTGAAKPYTKALEHDPVASGQLLQLPVYALAAQQHVQADGPAPQSVHAAYWFIDEGGITTADWPADEQHTTVFVDAVSDIVGGIEAGVFPMRQGLDVTAARTNCDVCPHTLICDQDRARRWTGLRDRPELSRLQAAADDD